MRAVGGAICVKRMVIRRGGIGSCERVVVPKVGVLPEMHTDVSTETKAPVLARRRRRYAPAGLEHKTKLLAPPVELLGCQRTAAPRPGAAPGPAQELFSKFWAYQPEGWMRRFFKDWLGSGKFCPSRGQ